MRVRAPPREAHRKRLSPDPWRAEESLKISTADAQLAASIGVGPGSPVVTIERTSFDIAGLTLEWRRSHARADHFEYRIEIR